MQKFQVKVNGKVFEVEVEEMGAVTQNQAEKLETKPAVGGEAATEPTVAPVAAVAPDLSGEDTPVPAPLSGTVMALKVKVGDKVQSGQVLLTLEALKMENEIVAPSEGVVKGIYVQGGATVNVGDVLLALQTS